MASNTAIAIAAAHQLTSTGVESVTERYVTWIEAQDTPALAGLALQAVQTVSKDPARVLREAAIAYGHIVTANDNVDTGGGPSQADLEAIIDNLLIGRLDAIYQILDNLISRADSGDTKDLEQNNRLGDVEGRVEDHESRIVTLETA